MKRSPLFPRVLIVTLLTCLVAAHATRADLQQDLGALIRDATPKKAEVGVQIMQLGPSADSTKVLFRHNSDIPLIPASNLKVVTTAAALSHLGPDFKFRTLLLKRNNDLILVGDGDPTTGDAEMFRKITADHDSAATFRNWGEALKKHGLVRFDRLLIDDSIFDQEFFHPNWPIDQAQRRYEAQVAGLNLNVNCVDFYLRYTTPGDLVTYTTNPSTNYISVQNNCTSGSDNAIWLSRPAGINTIILKGRTNGSTPEHSPLSVTIHDPALFTGSVVAQSFASSGVAIAKAPTRDRSVRSQLSKVKLGHDPAWTVLAVHETPLETVLARANKDSINLYAEALCKRIGAQTTGEQNGSWKTGTAAISAWLTRIGIDPSEFHLDDGCGLSKENAISANALCKILAHSHHNPDTRDLFLSTLSVAGKDGTLETRFAHKTTLDLRGRVFGKSGYVNGVITLSGYLKSKDDQWYGFSILVNQCNDIAAAKWLQEQIIRAIDRNSSTVAAVQ